MKNQNRGPGKTRTIDGERFRLAKRRIYARDKAEHVAAGHRGIGRKARLEKVTCPRGKKGYAVYVRGGRRR